MDVGAWLRNLGLEQYATAFRENEIDDKVLPTLTAEDLRDVGVGPVGHRRRLLDAIATLRIVPNQQSSAPDALPTSGAAAKDTAERRQVTVMFSDLVGSTALSARMDPEDLREVISAYHKCAAETVRRFGGFVSQYLGDGVLVYFGYPQAHEDDAERAVRAGLELVAAVRDLKTHAALQARVGIATGTVVVGDLMDAGNAKERGIIGETPNLAARLQGLAAPNSVVIAESTRRLLGNLFELEDLGPKDLKGISGPLRAFVALRPASVEGRFEAFHGSDLTELVGREEELELLLRRWSKAKTGEGQVVLLSGEAGIGKSRLTAALLERLANEPHTRLRYFCSPQHTDSALFPIVSQMERAAGFAHDDTAQAKLDKLDTVLAQSLTPRQDAALFAKMLSLPSDGRYPALEVSPQERRQRTLDALTTQVEALSRQKPVLTIFEDVHWIDPTSLEALGKTVDRVKALGVLLVVTYRPDFRPPWIGQPHVSTITINRLSQRDIVAMIERVSGNVALPENLRQDIIERTDGVPLFVEEMTKAVLETGSEAAAAQAISMAPSPAMAVPASLYASLMARLDRLGAAKEVAQIGAVIGREFSHALLALVVGKSDTDLSAAIDRLIEAGLLFRQGVPPHANYLFKHALVQDAAYGTLLRERRRALHFRIAETLENQSSETAENQPQLLARHYSEAGEIEKAAHLWRKAGQQSADRSGFAEAVDQFNRALDQIATLSPTSTLRREEIRCQVGLITPLMYLKGYGAPEPKMAAERARLLIEQAETLGEPVEDRLLLFSTLFGFWMAHYAVFDGEAARDIATQFLTLAEAQRNSGLTVVGHRMAGASSFNAGKIVNAKEHLDQGVALYNRAEHQALNSRFSVDSGPFLLSFRSLVLWILGYPDAARADALQALKDARETDRAPTLMLTLGTIVQTHTLCGDYLIALAEAEELVISSNKRGIAFWNAFARFGQGHLLALTGHSADAIQTISSAVATYRTTGSNTFLPWFLSNLSGAQSEAGQYGDAWVNITEAIELMGITQDRWAEAEVNRVAGEIALKSSGESAARAASFFERSLVVAREQQAKSWELRASMSLARLWRSHGKKDEARELLAPVYGWFTEGFDTLNLKEAKALLQELAA
jgi:class 3 adenylate cyclase/predicted ATPase